MGAHSRFKFNTNLKRNRICFAITNFGCVYFCLIMAIFIAMKKDRIPYGTNTDERESFLPPKLDGVHRKTNQNAKR